MKTCTLLAIAISILAGFAYGDSDNNVHSISLPVVHIELKAGEGKGKTETLCSICHSVDYITMQPKLARAGWSAEVNKMIRVMGAPIGEEDAKTITDYLVAEYGAQASR